MHNLPTLHALAPPKHTSTMTSSSRGSITWIRQLHSPDPRTHRIFIVNCHSHLIFTTVTSTPSVVRRWLHRIRHHHIHRIRKGLLVVGLGVQWTPGHQDSPATLQLCVGHRCLIFQLLHASNAPSILQRFLDDKGVTFVGVRNQNDGNLLESSKHKLLVSSGVVDLLTVASKERGYSKRLSMEKLAKLVVGMKGVKKKERVGRSDWHDICLSEDQVKYACLDAFLSFIIGKALKVWNWERVNQD